MLWPNELAQMLIALFSVTGDAQGAVVLVALALWFIAVFTTVAFAFYLVGLKKGWF